MSKVIKRGFGLFLLVAVLVLCVTAVAFAADDGQSPMLEEHFDSGLHGWSGTGSSWVATGGNDNSGAAIIDSQTSGGEKRLTAPASNWDAGSTYEITALVKQTGLSALTLNSTINLNYGVVFNGTGISKYPSVGLSPQLTGTYRVATVKYTLNYFGEYSQAPDGTRSVAEDPDLTTLTGRTFSFMLKSDGALVTVDDVFITKNGEGNRWLYYNKALNGAAKSGSTLTAVADSAKISSLSTPDATAYVWERSENGTDWTVISGETDASYQVTDADLGYHIRAGFVSNGVTDYTPASSAVIPKGTFEEQNFTSLDLAHTQDVLVKGASTPIAMTAVSDEGVWDVLGKRTVNYSYSNPGVIKVENDQITALAPGYTVLTASVDNPDGSTTEGKIVISVIAASGDKGWQGFETKTSGWKGYVTDPVRTGNRAYNNTDRSYLDLYGGYKTAQVSMAQGWFYDNGGKTADDKATLYIQSTTNRVKYDDEVYSNPNKQYTEWTSVSAITAGLSDPTSNYYSVANPLASRVNRGAGNVYLPKDGIDGNDKSGYTGDKTGTFLTDGTNGLPLITRSKGWHQFTVIINMGPEGTANIATDKGTTEFYLDGQLLFVEHYVPDGFGTVRANKTVNGVYDDLTHAKLAPNPASVEATDEYPIQAAKDEKGEYAAMRFIFKALVPFGSATENFGAYIVPWDVFSPAYDETTIEDSDPIKKVGTEIADGETYSVDLYGIPAAKFGADIYCLPFINNTPNVDAAYKCSVDGMLN